MLVSFQEGGSIFEYNVNLEMFRRYAKQNPQCSAEEATRASGKFIREIPIADEAKAYGNDCPNGACEG